MNRRNFLRSLIAPPVLIKTGSGKKPPGPYHIAGTEPFTDSFHAHRSTMEKIFPWLKKHKNWRVKYRIDFDYDYRTENK